MIPEKLTLEEMWAQQQIHPLDVNYEIWEKNKESLKQMSEISHSCIFTVDVYRKRYDFASDSFVELFGFKSSHIRNIKEQGDFLEDRMHPDDRQKILEIQIKHSQFIYSLPHENRNDYRNLYQFRMQNANGHYVNVISRQQVFQKDRAGKAWIIMGIIDISPDQTPLENVKYSALDLKTGKLVTESILQISEASLTLREKQILQMIHQGLLSKEIANRLNISIHTVNNHRKNILLKLNADNSIEAINYAKRAGLMD